MAFTRTLFQYSRCYFCVQRTFLRCVVFLCCLIPAHVLGQLTASFVTSDTSVCNPAIVTFSNTSTGATSYSWDLGNGVTTSVKDASASYLSAGTYTVTLTAMNGALVQKSSVVVRVYNGPTVNFAGAPLFRCPGDPVAFSNTTVANSWGTTAYTWIFGDGGSSTSATPSYAYITPGVFDVTLFATNAAGCIGSLKRSNYVFISTPAAISFNPSPASVCTSPAVVSFSNTTSGTPPFSCAWTFGDGGTSSGSSPIHTYSIAGVYDIGLRVRDGNGCVDSILVPGYVTIGNLKASYSASTHGCLYTPTLFTNTSTAYTSCKWYYGDGATSIGGSGAHTYTSPGTYQVKLVVSDGICLDSITKPVIVARPGGSYTRTTGPCPLPVSVTFNASVSAGASVTWVSKLFGSLGTGNPLTYPFPNKYPGVNGAVDEVTMYVTDVYGCKDTIKRIDTISGLFVNPGLIPPFKGCAPLTVKFSPYIYARAYTPFGYYPPFNVISYPYPYNAVSYSWDFGDGSPVITGPGPVHTYTAQGIYPVNCIATTTNGCTSVVGIDTVKVGSTAPNAGFTRVPSRVCAGQPVSFLSTSTGTINEYNWTFGDNGKSTDGPAVTHIYTVPGIFTVDLGVFNNGCGGLHYSLKDTVDSPSAVIHVVQSCTNPYVIAFGDSSYGDDSHLWSFGDGSTSTLFHPVYTYGALTGYTVRLTTYNKASGCRDTANKFIALNRLRTSLTPTYYSICRDGTDSIRASILNVMNGAEPYRLPVSSTWLLNGVVTDSHVPIYPIPEDFTVMTDSVYYTLHSRGVNTVKFVTLDNFGCNDTTSLPINAAKPVAKFTFTPSSGCVPLNVSFTDASTDIPGAFVNKFTWQFGDDSVSTVTTSVTGHKYLAAGTYTVTSMVTDNIGCSDTFTSTSYPNLIKPIANFSASTTKTCVNFKVSFNNTSTGATSFQWFFGDGFSSTSPLPDHTYTSPGKYSVRLVVTGATGCTDTMEQKDLVSVSDVPHAAFTMDDTFAVCPPLKVDFKNNSTGGSQSLWLFGDGTHSYNTSPVDVYTSPGTYKIILHVTNTSGCEDTAVGRVTIFGATGAFSYSPLLVCTSSPVHFSGPVSGVATVRWDYSDGVIATAGSSGTSSHSYSTVGRYVPKLILTDSAGCSAFSIGADTIKVDSLSPAFTYSPKTFCQNTPVVFSDSSYSYYSASQSWLWSFAPGATSTVNSPVYTYTASGTQSVKMTVTNAAGCTASATRTIFVNAPPGIISGVSSLCSGQSANFSNATPGGKWSCSNTSIATIDSVSGLLASVTPGVVNISYSLPSGCYVSRSVTINSNPALISGPSRICIGDAVTYSDAPAGGAWTSNSSSVLTIGSASGIVGTPAPGTATITYQLSSGCSVTKNVTVDPVPGFISGPANVCVGSAINLSNAVSGGSWTSANTGIATVGSSTGLVSGISVGTATVIYAFSSGCYTSRFITVLPPLSAISGPGRVCTGSSVSLSNGSSGGTWQSSNIAVATITLGSGKVTGVSPGSVTISYTSTAGCVTTSVFIVDTLPSAIIGAVSLCQNSSTTLSDAVSGGTWSTANTSVAGIHPLNGLLTGVSMGSATITYTTVRGCTAKTTITINPIPSAISGRSIVCAGDIVLLSSLPSRGGWSSDNTSVASVGAVSGIVNGISAGKATISYTLGTGCSTTQTITVLPYVATISGSLNVCVGSVTALTDTGAGTWTSGNTTLATVGLAGLVSGISAGVANITYTVSSGCKTVAAVTVNAVPQPVSGKTAVCTGGVIFLSDNTAGGSWSVDNTTVATVSSGMVYGAGSGTAAITYKLSTGCFVTHLVTVTPLPSAITGLSGVCLNSPSTFSSTTTGGTWFSGNTAVATIDPLSGILTTLSPGTATITYSLSTGCAVDKVVTVYPVPTPIGGPKEVCIGGSALLSDAIPGGVWRSGNTTVAIISTTSGLVTGLLAGTTTISYTLPTGCLVISTFTVHPFPAAISGITSICMGQKATLSSDVGGTWSSSNTVVAEVDGTGNVTAVSAGTSSITYVSVYGCETMVPILVLPVPGPITGKFILCRNQYEQLSDTVIGGIWSSTDSSVVAVNNAGYIHAVNVGSIQISYTLSNGCGAVGVPVRVDPLPYAGVIKGPAKLCAGETSTVSDSIAGGVWSSSDMRIAGVSINGTITAVAPGLVTLSYSYTNSCGTDVAGWSLMVRPVPVGAHITTHPDAGMCTNTLWQNFGADVPPAGGGNYKWRVDNGELYATGGSGQYCLVSFHNQGRGVVYLSSLIPGSECASSDSVVLQVGDNFVTEPSIVYYTPEFVCTDNTADSYQWGYDDASSLDSTLLPGMVNQNYYDPSPQLAQRYYWVLTYHNGCLQKTYYNKALAIVSGGSNEGFLVQLYPNPAGDILNVMVKGLLTTGGLSGDIVDVSGKKFAGFVFHGELHTININGLPPGVYMLRCFADGQKVASRPFVKK